MTCMKKYILLAAGLALTAGLAATVDKYLITSGELLANPGFARGLEEWQIDGPPATVTVTDGTLRLELREPGKSVEIEQTVTTATYPGFVLLEGELKSWNVTPGPEPWQRARLDFSRYGATGEWLPLPHNVVSLEGSEDWHHYQEIFRLVDGVSRSSVAIQLLSATGVLWVKNLSLHQVVPSPAYIATRIFLFSMWAAGLTWLFAPHVLGSGGKFIGIATGLALTLIIVGTMLPASVKARWQVGIAEMVHAGEGAITADHPDGKKEVAAAPVDQFYLIGNIEIGKAGHFVFFGLLGFLLLTNRGGNVIITTLAETAILGAATELMQIFVEGRTPLVSDFLTDMGGVTTGILLCLLWLRGRSLLPSKS